MKQGLRSVTGEHVDEKYIKKLEFYPMGIGGVYFTDVRTNKTEFEVISCAEFIDYIKTKARERNIPLDWN